MMGRKRGSRFKKVVDAQNQFEQIEKQQRDTRKGKSGPLIHRIDKSRKREQNAFDKIKSRDEVAVGYESDE